MTEGSLKNDLKYPNFILFYPRFNKAQIISK